MMPNEFNPARVAGMFDRSLYPAVDSYNSQKISYFVENRTTNAAESNIQIKEKTKANAFHYLIGAGLIVGLIYYASTQMD